MTAVKGKEKEKPKDGIPNLEQSIYGVKYIKQDKSNISMIKSSVNFLKRSNSNNVADTCSQSS